MVDLLRECRATRLYARTARASMAAERERSARERAADARERRTRTARSTGRSWVLPAGIASVDKPASD